MGSQPFWATPLLILPSPNSVLVEIIIVLMKNFKIQQIKWSFWKAQCKLTTRCTRRGWRSNKMGGVVQQQQLNARPWTTLGDVTNLPYNIPQSWHNNGAQLHNTLLASNNPNFVVAPQNLDSRAPTFKIKANGNWNLMNPWKRPQGWWTRVLQSIWQLVILAFQHL